MASLVTKPNCGKRHYDSADGASSPNRPPDPFAYYPRLQCVQRYIDEHMGQDVMLRDIAEVAGLTPKYFSTYFTRRVGKTFRQWLWERRTTRAADILASTEVAISIVYPLVGFRTMRSFQRSFKRHTGLTPLQYRRARAKKGEAATSG